MRSGLKDYITKESTRINVTISCLPPRLDNAKVVLYIADFLSGKSFLQYPTAEIYAATIMNKHGYKTVIYDNRIHHVPIDSFSASLITNSIHTVVFDTTPYDQVGIYYVDYRLDRIVYEVNYLVDQGFNVILVGSHATIRPLEMLKLTKCKIAIKGEWEIALDKLGEITDGFKNFNKETLLKCYNIVMLDEDMLLTSKINNSIMHPDIVNFPMPDYELINTSAYYGDEYEQNDHKIMPFWGSILAQRGCPYHCSFCYNFFGTHVRKRTPEQVVSEMELLERKYGVKMLFFIDDSFTLDKNWLHQVCEEIRKRKLKCAWNCETRVNLISSEILKDMKTANCNRIWLGAESFNNEILINANKEVTAEDTINAIHMIKQSGIHVSCFLMIGLPGETKNTIIKTLQNIIDSGIEYTKSIITFIPRDGTSLFSLVSEICDNPGFYDMNRYKGILHNEISEEDIIKAIETMSIRNVKNWRLDEIFNS